MVYSYGRLNGEHYIVAFIAGMFEQRVFIPGKDVVSCISDIQQAFARNGCAQDVLEYWFQIGKEFQWRKYRDLSC